MKRAVPRDPARRPAGSSRAARQSSARQFERPIRFRVSLSLDRSAYHA